MIFLQSCQKDTPRISKYSERIPNEQFVIKNPFSGLAIAIDSFPINYHITGFFAEKNHFGFSFKTPNSPGKDSSRISIGFLEIDKINKTIAQNLQIDSLFSNIHLVDDTIIINQEYSTKIGFPIANNLCIASTFGVDSIHLANHLKFIVEKHLKTLKLTKTSKATTANTLVFPNHIIGNKISLAEWHDDYQVSNGTPQSKISFTDTSLGVINIFYTTGHFDAYEYPPYDLSFQQYNRIIKNDTTSFVNNSHIYVKIKVKGKNHLLFYKKTEFSINSMIYYIDKNISICIALEPWAKRKKYLNQEEYLKKSIQIYSRILSNLAIGSFY